MTDTTEATTSRYEQHASAPAQVPRDDDGPLSQSIFAFIWKYSWRDQLLITAITVASFPFIYLSLQLPKVIVNDAISGKTPPDGQPFATFLGIEFSQPQYLLSLCGLLLLLYLVNGGFLFAVSLLKNLMSERLVRRIRFMLFERILRFPLGHFSMVSNAEMGSMIVGEVDRIREFMSDAISLPVFQGGTFSVILFFMFMQDWVLGLAAIALIPFQAWITPKFQRRINELGRVRVQQARKLSGRVSENVAGIRDIRSNHTFQYALSDFSAHLQRIFKIRYRLFQVKFLMKLVNNLLLKLTPLAFYALGGLLIINGRLSLGALVAVISAYGQLTAPWRELLRYYQRRGDAQIKYEQLVESFELSRLLEADRLSFKGDATELAGSKPKIGPEPPLEFDKIDISAPAGGSARLVEGFDLRVEAGQASAVLTPPGVREAVSSVLSAMVPPAGGEIRLGDQTLTRLSNEARSGLIGYVGSDSYVFEGSVGYNLRYALHRHPPRASGDGSYDAAEAGRTGNSPFDPEGDWSIPTDEPEIDADRRYHSDLLRAVGLADELFEKSMSLLLPDPVPYEMEQHILAMRQRLYADPEMVELFAKFNPDTYNKNATVAENLLFGVPVDGSYDDTSLGKSHHVRNALRHVGLEEDIYISGLKLSEKLLEFFTEKDADPALLDRFRLADAPTLEHLRKLKIRKFLKAPMSLSDSDKALMISLALKLVVGRHRLGLVNRDMRASIVKARHYLWENLPEAERAKVARFDQEGIHPKLSLMCNLLMGRVALDKPRAERRLLSRIRELAPEIGLDEDIQTIAQNFDVGIAGQNLSSAGRQALALARALAKRPKVLVANAALAASDPETRWKIRQNIVRLLPDIRMIWLEADRPPDGHFSQVVVIREVGEEPREPAMPAATPDAQRSEIDAEADALAAIPIFQNVSPTNRRLMALASRRVTFKPGDNVVTEGNMGDIAYVLLKGEVDVFVNHGTDDERFIARLGSNELIGETSLLTDTPRTATGIARTDIEALALEQETFLKLIESDAALASTVARVASERLANMLSARTRAKSDAAHEQ